MLSSVIVLAVGLPAVWIDTRTHRIPNVLVGITLLAALTAQLAVNGFPGLGLALAGAAVGLGLLLPLHVAGVMGAGDVKFMAALGALVGPYTAVYAVALALVAGSVLALAAVGWRRWAELTVPSVAATEAASGLPARALGRIPYAGAIVSGTLVATLISA